MMSKLNAAIVAVLAFFLGGAVGSFTAEHVKAKEVCMSVCDTKYSWYEDGRCICAEEKKAQE